MRRVCGLMVAVTCATVGAAEPQSADAVFSAWAWNAQARGPRVSGLGGAFVTTAQSGSAILLSPACLAFQPSREASFSVGAWPELSYTQALGVSQRWVVAARVGRSMDEEIRASGVVVTPQGTIDSGLVSFKADSLTVASSFRHRWGRYERQGLSVGASLDVRKLGALGTFVVYQLPTRQEHRVAFADGELGDRLRGTANVSLIYEFGHEFSDPRFRLGVALRGLPLLPGYWSLQRSTLSMVDGALAGPPEARLVDFRQPMAVSGAAETTWTMTLPGLGPTDFLLVSQADWTNYDAVLKALERNTPGDGARFVFEDGRKLDWSTGLEVRLKETVFLRTGMRVGHPRHFRLKGVSTDDESRARVSFGATVQRPILGKVLRIDMDWFRGFGSGNVRTGGFSGGAAFSL
jgi:hypothetical protein